MDELIPDIHRTIDDHIDLFESIGVLRVDKQPFNPFNWELKYQLKGVLGQMAVKNKCQECNVRFQSLDWKGTVVIECPICGVTR